ncbi:MAG: hypothetical protein LBM98_04615 [Oscillospiraceae bacterium]|nr:hypothetical protein [Oscillospiraceae bacterium]
MSIINCHNPPALDCRAPKRPTNRKCGGARKDGARRRDAIRARRASPLHGGCNSQYRASATHVQTTIIIHYSLSIVN